MVTLMANATLGICSLERNGILAADYSCKQSSSCESSTYWRPIFGTPLDVRKVKQIELYSLGIPSCGKINALVKGESEKQLVGGGILDKEFKFRTSFDQYLKAMESVKRSREKKHSFNSKKYGSKNGIGEEDGDNAKLGRSEAHQSREKKYGVIGQNESSWNGHGKRIQKGLGRARSKDVRKRNLRQGSLEKDSAGNVRNSVQGGLNDRERNASVNVKMNSLTDRKNGRQLKYQTSTFVPKLDSRLGMKDRNLSRSLDSDLVHERNHIRQTAPENGRGLNDWDGNIVPQLDSTLGITLRQRVFEGGELAHERSHIRHKNVIGRRTAPKDGNVTLSSGSSYEVGDDMDMTVERAAFKNFDEFGEVVDKPRIPRREMEDRIQKLAKWLNGADINMPEWMFSKMMRSAQIRFTDHSILRVIQIMGKLGNWRRVLQVIEWLRSRDRFKSYRTRFIYTTALNVLGKARRPVEALNVFYAMQHHMSSYPDLVAYHCIAVALGQAGHMKELFDVIDFMRSSPPKKIKSELLEKWDPRLEPDIIVYNAVLNACVKQKQWEGAFWVLQQLKQQGQQPSSSTYGLVMEVMFACGKYNLVYDFFRRMQKSCIPNALTYKVLINTLWREGKTSEALSVVEEMERRGIVGSAALYYDLARCLCSAGRCEEALMQVEKICRVANKPLVVTYTGLIQACLTCGDIHNATYIFHQMQNFCRPNLVTCNVMIKAYAEHGMLEEAKELFQKMLEDGNHIGSISDYKVRVIPDIYTFNTILDACTAAKRWDDFENVYERMLNHGYHFNAKRHLRMILDASRAGKVQLLETTWKHLAQQNRSMPLSLIKERFCVKLENGDYTAAISCITSQYDELQACSKWAWLNLFEENMHRFEKETLGGFIDQLNFLCARNEPPNPVLQNLVISCKQVYRALLQKSKISQLSSI